MDPSYSSRLLCHLAWTHSLEVIGKYYTFKVDEEAKQYVGIHLKWNYDKQMVRLSMDGFVKQALLAFRASAYIVSLVSFQWNRCRVMHPPFFSALENFPEPIGFVNSKRLTMSLAQIDLQSIQSKCHYCVCYLPFSIVMVL